MEDKTIIALEIGSSKIKGALGFVSPTGALSVKAIEEEPVTDIVRYGRICNVVETAAAIRQVISRLEQREPGRKVERVYLSVGGRSLSSESIDIERLFPAETLVTDEIIADITREALARPLAERSVVTALMRELRIDGAKASRPVGMPAHQVTARLDLVSCRSQLLKNLMQVIEERLSLEVADVYVRPIVEAGLVLMPDEKQLGCMLVDFGAETTTVAIYRHNALVHLAVIPIGSRNITRDITCLNYLEEQAEELKVSFGNAMPSASDAMGIRPAGTDMTAVNNYVSARAGEILLNVVEQIKYAGLTPDNLPGGIVMVGRGARLGGLGARLEQMLPGMKVRVGAPSNTIRILDGRIQSADAVDVIAIMNEAARKGRVKECMSLPPVVEHEPQRPAYEPQRPAYEPQRQQQQQPYQHPHAGNVRAAAPRQAAPQGSYTPNPTPTPAGSRPAPAAAPVQAPQQPAPQQPAAADRNMGTSYPPAGASDIGTGSQAPAKPAKPGFVRGFTERLRQLVVDAVTDNLYQNDDDN